jgi:hypothetical protein
MTHDWMCPINAQVDFDNFNLDNYLERYRCQCELILKVRADELRRPSEDGWMSVRAVLAWEDQVRTDERSRCIQEIENHYYSDEDTDYWTGFEDGIRKAVDLLDMGRSYE